MLDAALPLCDEVNAQLHAWECGSMAKIVSGAGENGKKVGKEGKVLASGFDSLNLSLMISWKHDGFFQLLKKLKADAMAQGAAMPGKIEAGADSWIFNVEPYGAGGYAYLLDSHGFYIKLIEKMSPTQRPSIIEIRSVTLWQMGVIEAVDWILSLLQAQGADMVKVMSCRGDPCMDILLPDTIWKEDLLKHAVKRARHSGMFHDNGILTGISIGKGNIQVRLYDKPLEILNSKKTWMYDIWGIKEVPPGYRVIRVEFQIRREVFVELGIDTVWHMLNHPRKLWAYCTENWIKFQNHTELHHTQQKPMPWWKTVQNNFLGGQRECPLVRAKTVAATKVQIAQQLFGQINSLLALEADSNIQPGGEIQIEEPLSKVIESAQLIKMTPGKTHERVRRKKAKYTKATGKFKEAQEHRKQNGLPYIQRPDEKGGAA